MISRGGDLEENNREVQDDLAVYGRLEGLCAQTDFKSRGAQDRSRFVEIVAKAGDDAEACSSFSNMNLHFGQVHTKIQITILKYQIDNNHQITHDFIEPS